MSKKTGPVVHAAHDRMVPTKDLKPNPANPNRHSQEQVELLARIIEKAGWRQVVTVSNLSGLVVRGHGRLEAAILLGLAEVPVDFQDYASEAEELADMVADNRLAELADRDYMALADLFAHLDTGEIDLELTGYDEEDIRAILADMDEADPIQWTPGTEGGATPDGDGDSDLPPVGLPDAPGSPADAEVTRCLAEAFASAERGVHALRWLDMEEAKGLVGDTERIADLLVSRAREVA